MTIPSLYIVGAGRVGLALARAAREAALPLAGLWTRSEAGAERARAAGLECDSGALAAGAAEAGLVIIAAADPVVPYVAGALLDGGLLRSAAAVLHCGGARPAREALAPLVPHLAVGTFHPLLSIVNHVRAARELRGARVAVEGDLAARALAAELARALGAQPLELRPEAMGIYHAAAVLAASHALALWGAGLELLREAAGLDADAARAALAPLVRSALANFEALGMPAALTGPARRGDQETIALELALLAARAPDRAELYRAASLEAVAQARSLVSSPDEDAALAALESFLRR